MWKLEFNYFFYKFQLITTNCQNNKSLSVPLLALFTPFLIPLLVFLANWQNINKKKHEDAVGKAGDEYPKSSVQP